MTLQDGRLIDCIECGSYHICDYCYQEFKEKNDHHHDEEAK